MRNLVQCVQYLLCPAHEVACGKAGVLDCLCEVRAVRPRVHGLDQAEVACRGRVDLELFFGCVQVGEALRNRRNGCAQGRVRVVSQVFHRVALTLVGQCGDGCRDGGGLQSVEEVRVQAQGGQQVALAVDAA